MVIRTRPEKVMPNGELVPAHEGYPSNSEWGRYGWSFPIRERALVFELALKMANMEGPYPSLVRKQMILHVQAQALIRTPAPTRGWSSARGR